MFTVQGPVFWPVEENKVDRRCTRTYTNTKLRFIQGEQRAVLRFDIG
jgi:hypothetical protein